MIEGAPSLGPMYVPLLKNDDYTLTYSDLLNESYVLLTVAGKVLTFPTPSIAYLGHKLVVGDKSGSQQTLSCTGGFVGGNTVTLDGYSHVEVVCAQTAASTYKWIVKGTPTSAAISAETIRNTIGTAIAAGVHTNISVTVSDVGDSISFASNAAVVLSDTLPLATASTSTSLAGTGVESAREDHVHGIGTHVHEKATNGGHLCYYRTALTGGGATALDGVAYADLADGNRAFVLVGNNPGVVYPYVFDIDNGGAESSPRIIAPDDAAANPGRWVLAITGADEVGLTINAATSKATPVDADSIVVVDSAASNLAKKSTLAQLRTALLAADPLGTVVAGLTAKASPIDADIMVVADTADTNDAKAVTLAQLRTALLAADPLGTVIDGLTGKASPIDADEIVVADTAATNDAKKVTLAQLRTALLAADPFGSVLAGFTAKASPVDADSIAIADSAATNDAKTATLAELRTMLLAADPLGTVVAGLTDKASPVDADVFLASDSAATNDAKKVTAANLKTYMGIPVKATGAEVNTGTDDAKFVTAKAITDSELGALLNSINWQDWSPTFAGVPAVDSTVARYQRVGNSVRGYIDIRGSDGDGWVPSTCTLPVAPSDVNARIPIQARQKVNAAAATDMEGYIDAETDLRMEFEGAAACTDTQAWHLYIWFEYEVAAS